MKALILMLFCLSISMTSYSQYFLSDFMAENMEKKSGNESPAVSLIPCQTIQEGHTSDVLSFNLVDDYTSANKLKLRVESSNPALIPAKNVHIRGKGENRAVQFTSANHATGTVMLTIFVKDKNGAETATSFEVHVDGISAQY